MLYEQALCKKEKEHQRNLKHQVNGKCKLTQLQDCSKNFEDMANVKCVENGDRLSQAGSAKSSNSKSSSNHSNSSSNNGKASNGNGKSSSSNGKSSSNCLKSAQPPRVLEPKDTSKCYEKPARRKHEPCKNDFKWQHAEYCRDECGSGIVPLKMTFAPNRKMWCSTPLSMYQSTIGELARKILCDEFKLQRDINPAPPCNVCEYAMPLCRGYYRKYDCMRPCEEDFARRQNGYKVYRDRVQRYWEPCLMAEQKPEKSVRHYAQHNAYLGEMVRRKFQDAVPCW